MRPATARADRAAQPDARDAARQYIARGWSVVDVPARAKAPTRHDWQHARLTADDIDPAGNIGLLLGEPSGGLTDVDLDAPEAIAAAPYLLPQTDMVHGRASRPASHWWYVITGDEARTTRYRDPHGATLIELRSTGAQTIVPPSTHPSGEVLTWESDGEPARVDATTLRRAVARVAACAMVARRWPQGSRHEVALALAGLLLRGGVAEDGAARFVEAVARVASDSEWRDRVRAVHDTYADTGPRTGGPRLAQLLPDGEQVVAKLREWLGLRGEIIEVARPPLRVVNVAEFLRLEFPARENILTPWLPRQGLALVHAWRGVGKTFFGLFVAAAAATAGRFLKWEAPIARHVLYVDGEMPGIVMQERLARIFAATTPSPDPDFLRLLTPDLQEHEMPDLSTERGQAAIEPHLAGVDLVVVDNVSTLCRSGVESEAESWLPVQGWSLALRRRGISALLFHHDGKAGLQRGTSRREDVLDSVIALKRPRDYRPEQGARFEVHFEKSRGFHGPDAEPFEASLIDDGAELVWTVASLEDRLTERVAALLKDGMRQRDAARELGIGVASINRHAKKARALGLLDG